MARRHAAAGWSQAPRWGPAPGWDPLDDPGVPFVRAAGLLGRWWWPITAVAGFLATVAYVLAHDDPQPGLSDRSLLTVSLAAVVMVLLTAHRARGGRPPRAPLARALAEYAVVALLAALLATAGTGQPPADHGGEGSGRRQATERPAHRHPPAERADAAPAADRRPGIVRVVSGVRDWLADLWHTAGELADRRSSPPATTTPALPTRRSHP